MVISFNKALVFFLYLVFTPHIYLIILISMIAGNLIEIIRLPKIQSRKCLRKSNLWRYSQGSPHIVKTGWLEFSLFWLKGEVWENLGDFRKLIQILTFLSPLPHVPLPFTKTNVLHYDLKKDAINEFGIKYWTSNPGWVTFQEHGSFFYVNIEEKVWLLVKKIQTCWKDWQGD